ncbi:hypothetical protein MLD38_009864 [Melastoma candidum]|uniref:Uncharacterized protein n=1 Tax=Melastoma candidum TaxID=119954 RepID=A0ACB9S7F8_9MYRT|nr:hypothetical protein MLD38_009864 [Melastoma candidum]
MSSSAAAREAGGTLPYGSSPGGGGGGAGGKFRKKPYRRSAAATPYDRPPSSVRNFPGFLSGLGQGSGAGNDGWLRRIVDPAQRLIAAGAHKLFASVFQKRLTQPPPPQPPEKVQEALENQQEPVPTRPSREHQETISKVEKSAPSIGDGSLVNLEKILTQRTFSKSEIDRLTSLLHAKKLDSSIASEVKRPEVSSSGPCNLKDGSSIILRKADGHENRLPVTPVNVLDHDVASPTELAKAYMGTRASKMSPSGAKEDYLSTNISQQPLGLPDMSLIPTSSDQRVDENGYIAPKSRGRSAIYSMARAPYARVHHTTPLKMLDEHGDGRSVASQTLEPGRISGSDALKRRSSIFENDIGSNGLSRTPFSSDELPSAGNRLEDSTVERNAGLNDKVVDLDKAIPLAAPSAPMNQSFRMSALEDYVDLDEDDQQTEAVSTLPVDNRNKLESTMEPAFMTEAVAKEKPVHLQQLLSNSYGTCYFGCQSN